jgi:hypothetical protein
MDTETPIANCKLQIPHCQFAIRLGLRSLILLTFVILSGCRNPCELVEADLRAREAELAQLRQELERRDCNIKALEIEVMRLQRQCHSGGAGPVMPAWVVKKIVLGRLTGGVDEDPHLPGDEALQVILEPHDCDDQSIKAPGSLRLEVFEITPQGLKVALSAWDITEGELRKKWETPVFGNPGYRIVLPWKSWPATERVRVVARFTTPDGQVFEADRDVSVRAADLTARQRRDPPCPPAGPVLAPLSDPAAQPPIAPPAELPPTMPPPAAPSPAPPPPSQAARKPVAGRLVRTEVTTLAPAPPPTRPSAGLKPPLGAKWTPVPK